MKICIAEDVELKLEKIKKGPKRHCGHYFKGVICPDCGHLSFPSKK